eukprot:331838_1
MSLFLSTFTFCLSVVAIYSQTTLPNINYISYGYNIIKGNPHTTANSDIGWLHPLFSIHNFSDNNVWNNFIVPNGINVISASTCDGTSSYSSITGTNSYTSSLDESVSVSGGYAGAKFSASTDYQNVYKQTTSNHLVYASAYYKCAVYTASLNFPFDIPSFTANFYDEVDVMPVQYDPNNETTVSYFYKFIDEYFGTHYVKKITMGGIFGQLSNMNSYNYSKYTSSDLTISVSASYSALGASAAASSMTNTSKQEANSFDSVTNHQSVFNIGGNIPSDGNWAEWQKTLISSPMPTYFELDTISNLITSQYFPDIEQIGLKQSALQSAISAYCSLFALYNPSLSIPCNGSAPDPALPLSSIFGGIYVSIADANQPPNPYTKEFNCKYGFEPIESAVIHPAKSGGSAFFPIYTCINTTQNKHDNMNYFGGMFMNYTDPNKVPYFVPNYFTGGYSCPQGFTTQRISEFSTYYCYNASTPYSSSIIGGFYAASSDSRCIINNQYTKTGSCPYGFTAYLIASFFCWNPNTSKLYICLSNHKNLFHG